MAFAKGKSGNPGGRSREKLWREAILRAVKRAAPDKSDGKALDKIADAVVLAACSGDIQAIKEIGDRLDGKPAQALVGGDDDDNPVKFQMLEVRIVDPQD